MLEYVKCNLCGQDNYSVIYKAYAGDISALESDYKITDHAINLPPRIVKCRHCGFVYANPRQPAKDLSSIYKNLIDALYVQEEQGRRLAAKSILNILQKMRKSGRLLEIGCATGFLLDEARKVGWDVSGVELSAWAVKYAQDNLGITYIFEGVLEDARYPGNYFDAVILKDTIEHLPDPRAELIEIRRILKSDGVICVNTPDIDSLLSKILKARWWGVKQQHLSYFNRKTLSKMLQVAGFVPVKTKSHARVFSLKYWVSRLNAYHRPLHGIFVFLINRGIVRNELFRIDFKDQLEVYAKKMRKIEYLEELESPRYVEHKQKLKTVVVLPAYNAAKTIEKTVRDIPDEAVDEIILVDDASTDQTVSIAKNLGLKVFVHQRNKGYGANQKTCYRQALEEKADVVVMVHPDYQYDPKVIRELIAPIKEGRADAVFGSRMMKGGALEGGMPPWKHNANILLSAIENVAFGTFLTEYHSGFRAYSSKLLQAIKFELNSDHFVFDTEIIAQILTHNFKIEEISIRTRYFDEASTIKLFPSIIYGLGILKTILKYYLHTRGIIRFKQFE
jgi:SAM-dependent methyltransferase